MTQLSKVGPSFLPSNGLFLREKRTKRQKISLCTNERTTVRRLTQATEDNKALLGHLMFVVGKVGRETTELADGFRVVINDGKHAGQSVYHLHIHIIGGKQLGWPPGTD
mmetsp:Transcript_28365/g.91459  ORF Transcript_28365/g.91459 Transcript_28365/m.91459 type:complete len:109 (-) Transcript_28365:277-603(-)